MPDIKLVDKLFLTLLTVQFLKLAPPAPPEYGGERDTVYPFQSPADCLHVIIACLLKSCRAAGGWNQEHILESLFAKIAVYDQSQEPAYAALTLELVKSYHCFSCPVIVPEIVVLAKVIVLVPAPHADFILGYQRAAADTTLLSLLLMEQKGERTFPAQSVFFGERVTCAAQKAAHVKDKREYVHTPIYNRNVYFASNFEKEV